MKNNQPNQNVNLTDPSEKDQMIAEAAYFKAEKRNFALSNDLEDWLEAEIEIEGYLNSFQD